MAHGVYRELTPAEAGATNFHIEPGLAGGVVHARKIVSRGHVTVVGSSESVRFPFNRHVFGYI